MQWLKQRLRRQMQNKRLALSPAEQTRLAQIITQRLLCTPYFQQAQCIALYWSVRSEVMTSILLDHLTQHKIVTLPRIKGPQLEFAQIEAGVSLVPNKYDILEPGPQAKIIPANKLDLVIVPLVAFDHQGHRLGTGGGFYDRTFKEYRTRSLLKQENPLLVGLAYDFQKMNQLPRTEFDVKLDFIITEKRIYLALPKKTVL